MAKSSMQQSTLIFASTKMAKPAMAQSDQLQGENHPNFSEH